MKRTLSACATLVTLACVAGCGPTSKEPAYTPANTAPAAHPGSGIQPHPAAAAAEQTDSESVEVLLCDGKTKTTVPKGTPGSAIASSLMSEWLRKNPDATWEQDVRERHGIQPAADNKELIGQGQGQTYGRVTEQDVLMWKREAERLAVAGARVFHSADELGSTFGVSCDMCHPHAANTHPETYPKFQVQLGRVVLLRDMINWCVEHPLRGKAIAADDPRMRALEAYIYAQRSGKTLSYGKH